MPQPEAADSAAISTLQGENGQRSEPPESSCENPSVDPPKGGGKRPGHEGDPPSPPAVGGDQWHVEFYRDRCGQSPSGEAQTASTPQQESEPTWGEVHEYAAAEAARKAGIDPSLFPSLLTTFPHIHGDGGPIKAQICRPRPEGEPEACLPSKNFRGEELDPEEVESPRLAARLSAPESTPKKRAQVEVTRGAGVVKVQREHEQHGRQPPERKEGDIVGFSQASARRLQVRMGKIREDHKPVFATATYPDVCAWSGERVKSDIEDLWKRLDRRFSGISLVWKLEFERRKSGALGPETWVDPETGEVAAEHKGCQMPHVHMLIFFDQPGEWDQAHYEAVRRAIAEHWHAIVWRDRDAEELQQIQDALRDEDRDVKADHREAGTRTERIRSRRGTLHYVSEYIASPEDGLEHSIGRYWGIYGRKNLPLGETVTVAVSDEVACKMLRAVMKAEGRDYEGLPLTRTHLCSSSRPWELWVLDAIAAGGISKERAERWVDYISAGENQGDSPSRKDMERPSTFGEWEGKHLN